MNAANPNRVRLGPRDAVADRPFAAPEHSRADAAILEAVRAQLSQTLAAWDVSAAQPDPSEIHVQYLHDQQGRLCRMIILDRAALAGDVEIAFVGFFGQRRGDANPALLQDVDTELIQEFLHHRYVLSYCSLELADGNWANMVLLRHIEGIQHWRLSQKHAYAARELAPLFYTGIRLHNGRLPNGLGSSAEITSTKYYDFSGSELWHAIREEGIGL